MSPLQDGSTPLVLAAYHGHFEIARLLLDSGADKEATDAVRGNWDMMTRGYVEEFYVGVCEEVLSISSAKGMRRGLVKPQQWFMCRRKCLLLLC